MVLSVLHPISLLGIITLTWFWCSYGPGNVSSCFSLHQVHIINPRWIEETSPEQRKRLVDVVKSADHKLRGSLQTPVYQQYQALIELHKDPWTSPAAVAILSGKPDSKSIGNFTLN